MQRQHLALALGAEKMRRVGERVSILAVILLAFALRVFRLGAQELRGDETFGYFFSLRPVPDIIWATLTLGEPHPVGSYLIEKGWLSLAGHSEFALRFISAWFGTLAVGIVYRLGRRLGLPRGTAGLGAFLLAISPYAIWHSQDARMYTMSLALTAASTWLALEMTARPRRSLWIAYVSISWSALQVHYFAGFVLLAQNVFVFGRAWLRPQHRGEIPRWATAQLAIAVLYAPWLWLARDTIAHYGGNGDSPGLVQALWRAFSAFAVGETVPTGRRPLYALLSGLLMLGGAFRLMQAGGAKRGAVWLLALYLVVPLGITWISARSRPIFNERYLIAATPPFYLLVAAAASIRVPSSGQAHTSRAIGRAASLLLLVVMTLGALGSLGRYYTDPAYSKTIGWRALAETIQRWTTGMPVDQVRIAQNFPDPTLWYYYRGPVEHVVLPPAAHDADGADREVAGLVSQGVTWVILPVQLSPLWDDAGIAQAALTRAYARVLERPVGVWPLQLYVRPDPERMQSLDVTFANGLTLRAAAVEPQTLVPGGVLAIHLRWEGRGDALTGTEKLFVHLVPAEGLPVPIAQTDPPLRAADVEKQAVSYAILLPETLPQGAYRVLAGIYNPGQPGAPRIPTVDGADHVELASSLTRQEKKVEE
ncbi:MAG TPA: phospholipid carrier-dependent glycosyltransferase [Caldilineae bacterium]|nr:phospholipid carrier-dependent glycosyltransferase [Caldilineae bacterium]